ncbi:MAG: DUF3219 family protein [Bacillales bacterium]|nr:DUF3219 family protein [Bacillales bacterium]
MTVLLYKNTFGVKSPGRNLQFKGTIHQYSISKGDFSVENKVADITLE